MSPRRVFLPAQVRAALAALPPSDQLAVETELENLGMAVADPAQLLQLTARLADGAGSLITDVAGTRIHFSVDAFTRVLYVHRVEVPRGTSAAE